MNWISAEDEKKGRRPLKATPHQVIIRLNPKKTSFGMSAVFRNTNKKEA